MDAYLNNGLWFLKTHIENLFFLPKKLFIEILIGLTFLITSNYLKSALLYSDLVSVFGIALDFYIL